MVVGAAVVVEADAGAVVVASVVAGTGPFVVAAAAVLVTADVSSTPAWGAFAAQLTTNTSPRQSAPARRPTASRYRPYRVRMGTTRAALLQAQLRVTWALATDVLHDLTDAEALWCPSSASWTVRPDADRFVADWEEPEPWPAPPPSIAWLQWHVVWWWSTVIDRTFGDGRLRREDVAWPGASPAMTRIDELREAWIARLDALSDADLSSGALTRWPYVDGRPFADVAGWVNVELTKNIAEMCTLRRLNP